MVCSQCFCFLERHIMDMKPGLVGSEVLLPGRLPILTGIRYFNSRIIC
uniref:Uncharacterized protein n=1 Tax=Rhizophora mucronata TaxID=61149 RepID=A0A2P2PCS1_RHIMU